MGLSKNSIFALIFLSTTMVFSFIGYKPIDVVIGGPNFPQIDYFQEEMDLLSEELGITIQYQAFSDIETHLIENPNHDLDIAIIPNPQGVVNLGQRGLAVPINEFLDNEFITTNFSQHLIDITTSQSRQSQLWSMVQSYSKFINLV